MGLNIISLGMKWWFHQLMFNLDIHSIHSSLMFVPITSKEMETIAFISSVPGRGGRGGHWIPRRKEQSHIEVILGIF